MVSLFGVILVLPFHIVVNHSYLSVSKSVVF